MKKISLKYARRKVRVARDEAGVPHVEARSWREALYGLGYMHGVDRHTQILFARTLASGTASQRITAKEELLETDRFFRKANLYNNLDNEVSLYSDKIFGDLTSYCEGVNDGMKQSGRSLPMWATGFHPQPWNQKSVVLIGQLLSFAGLAVGQQQSERLLVELIQLGVDDDKLRELFSPMLDQADFEMIRKIKISHKLSDEALSLLTDLPRLVGSNAWAISPQRSATGNALLASDPHLEVNRLPSIWYEAVLKWDDRYVMGATLPGCPLFAVARTPDVSWGVTYMKGDTCDYFVEDCRTGGESGWQYRRGQSWHDFRLREETIEQKGQEADVLKVYENDIGTLDADPNELGPGHYLSASWAGSREGSGKTIAVWLEVVGSRDVQHAMDIVRTCPQPSLCWVFADSGGHIGMQGSGWFPKRRKGVSGLLPIPAWDEKNHWTELVDSNLLPQVYDPPEGYIATANENINALGGYQFVTLPVSDYRKRRLEQRLPEIESATLADMQALQYDVISPQAEDLLAIFLPHMPDSPIKELLANWDFSYTPERVEPALFARLYRNVLLEIFGHEQGIGWQRMLYLCSRVGYSTMVLNCADRLLSQDESLWWKERDKGELIALAAEKLAKEKLKPWRKVNSFRFTNRFFGDQKRVGRALGFHTELFAMIGCHATVFQGHLLQTRKRASTFAPSYHFVTDMGTQEAWTNLPGGPSESRFSKYYKIDIPRWSSGEYKRLSTEE